MYVCMWCIDTFPRATTLIATASLVFVFLLFCACTWLHASHAHNHTIHIFVHAHGCTHLMHIIILFTYLCMHMAARILCT